MAEMHSFKSISELTGIPLSSLYMYNSQGKGPVCTKIGRHYLVSQLDLETWLEANRHYPTK